MAEVSKQLHVRNKLATVPEVCIFFVQPELLEASKCDRN